MCDPPLAQLNSAAHDTIGARSEVLADNGTLVVHALTSRAPLLNWGRVLSNHIRVQGFDARAWIAENHSSRLLPILESVGKLVAAGKLHVACAEYELASELEAAREHQGGSLALLRMTDVGEHL